MRGEGEHARRADVRAAGEIAAGAPAAAHLPAASGSARLLASINRFTSDMSLAISTIAALLAITQNWKALTTLHSLQCDFEAAGIKLQTIMYRISQYGLLTSITSRFTSNVMKFLIYMLYDHRIISWRCTMRNFHTGLCYYSWDASPNGMSCYATQLLTFRNNNYTYFKSSSKVCCLIPQSLRDASIAARALSYWSHAERSREKLQ